MTNWSNDLKIVKNNCIGPQGRIYPDGPFLLKTTNMLTIILITVYIISLTICRYLHRLIIKKSPNFKEDGNGVWVFTVIPIFNTMCISLYLLWYMILRRRDIAKWITNSDLD